MGTLVCRIELNKTSGITVTVNNEDGKIVQTMVMDGTSITTTCKGDKETSTITQKQDSIAIKCKDFSIDAETINCKSSKTTKHESKDTFDIISTKDMSLKSSANTNIKATSDIKISGKNITDSAQMNSKTSATNVELSGKSKVKASGAQLELAGSGQAKMSGAMIEIKASGILTVKGNLTNVEGQITNVKGSLVNLG